MQNRKSIAFICVHNSCRSQIAEALGKKYLSAFCDVSLLGKWLPSVNTSNKETVLLARKLARAFGLTEREYRQKLSALRKQIAIIENNLREKDYSFDYAKQPGRAMFKYRQSQSAAPVTKNEQGVVLVSGCNPRLFSQVVEGNVNPYQYMMEVVGADRYEKVVA